VLSSRTQCKLPATVVRRRGLVFSAPKLAKETKDEQEQEQDQEQEMKERKNEWSKKRGAQYYCAGNGVEDLMIRSRL
jgi:hypothetical protein